MKKHIVVINGTGGSGKDEFVKQCKKVYNNIANLSTVDYVKIVAIDNHWWDGKSKTEKDRRCLSDLKDLLTRWDDLPFRITCSNIDNNIYDDIIFVHSREPEYIQRYVDRYNAKTLLIKNPRVSIIESNHADSDVLQYDYDYIVNNDGTLAELYIKAYIFINEILNNMGGNICQNI